jgi:hypothetical protein
MGVFFKDNWTFGRSSLRSKVFGYHCIYKYTIKNFHVKSLLSKLATVCSAV